MATTSKERDMQDMKDEVLTDEPEQVQFLFKAIYDRDPKKRRVKPVERHLLQVDFGLSDSENDSDYEVQEGSDYDSDGNPNEDDDDEQSDNKQEDCDSEVEGSRQHPDSSDNDTGGHLSIGELLEKTKPSALHDKNGFDGSGAKPADSLQFHICSVCLGEVSEDSDEIIECDNCGVTVHEGCYGENLADNESVSSVQTESSTEPWFCDACKAACKAGESNPSCELCPNLGGIFKETDAGRWVHIVCALYVPGVAFGDVEKLRWVTLSEMNPSKWGARECCYCEDERFNRTGVCIGCDAGMCKNYFHVTCGQRMGLLSEVAADVHIADPFYAYCKLHVDKSIMRYKKQNFIAVHTRPKHILSEAEKHTPIGLRILSKLDKNKERYCEIRLKKPAPWVPSEKVPRAITTSASACRKLMRKAELMGICTDVTGTTHTVDNGEVKKKWHVSPAFSAEFVNYFVDRDTRLIDYKHQLTELVKQSEILSAEEQQLRNQYNKLSEELSFLKVNNPQIKQEAEAVWKILNALSAKKLPVPECLKSPKIKKSPQKKAEVKSPPTILHICNICESTQDQHFLIMCETCKKYYHLGCLDPPLTRMPKKTSYSSWQCSECVDSSSDEDLLDLADETEDSTRRLKRAIKEPSKYTPVIPFLKRPAKKGRKRLKKAARPSLANKGTSTAQVKHETDSVNDIDGPSPAKKQSPPVKSVKGKTSPSTSAYVPPTIKQKTPTVVLSKNIPKELLSPPQEKALFKKVYSPAKKKPIVVKRKAPPIKKSPPVARRISPNARKITPPAKYVSSTPFSVAAISKMSSQKLKSSIKEEPADDRDLVCAECKLPGVNKTLVCCDQCSLHYHFMCLDPPCKKTPKVTGYGWLCINCVSSDGSDDED